MNEGCILRGILQNVTSLTSSLKKNKYVLRTTFTASHGTPTQELYNMQQVNLRVYTTWKTLKQKKKPTEVKKQNTELMFTSIKTNTKKIYKTEFKFGKKGIFT